MSLDNLVMTTVAIFVIFGVAQQFIISSNLSIYNFVLAGLAVQFVLLIIYQHFDFIFILLIKSNSVLQSALIQEPKFIIKLITNMAMFFGLSFGLLYIKVVWLSSKFDRFVQRHLYHQAADIAEQRLKFLIRFYGAHYITGSAVTGLAAFYANLGKREKAKRLFLEALEIFSKSFFFNSQDKSALEVKIKSKLHLSNFYLLDGDLAKAETYCQEVLELQGNRRVSGILIAKACQQMALIQGFKGNLDTLVSESSKAKNVYQNWLENKSKFQKIREKLKSADYWFVTNAPILIIALVFLPPIFFSFFRTQEYLIFVIVLWVASQFIDSWLKYLHKQNSETQESILEYCLLIELEGSFYVNMSDYDLAQEKYNEVLDKLSTFYENSISKELVCAKSWLNLASLQATRGLLESTSLEKKQEYYETAILNYDKALIIYDKINNYRSGFVPLEYRNQHINCLLERYLTYARLIGIEAAEDEVLQAFSDAEKLLAYPSSEYASKLIELGFIYHWIGRYDDAEDKYLKAEQIIVQHLDAGFYAKSQLDFAKTFLYVATGRSRDALKSIRRSNEMNNRFILQNLSVTSERHRINFLQNSQVHFNCYASLVYQLFSNYPSHSEVGALLDLVLQRKAIGAEVLATQRDVLLEDRYPPQKLEKLKLKLEELTSKRREIAHKILEGIAPSDVEGLKKINRDREKLEENLAREIPELNLEKKMKAVDRNIVSQALSSDSVLIEIVLVNFVEFSAISNQIQSEFSDSAHYLAFILLAGQANSFQLVDLGSAETIDRLLTRFRVQVTREFRDISINPRNRHFSSPYKKLHSEDNGIALRTKIFDPLVSAIGERRKLFISPDGNLTQIPFEILPTDDGRQLIDLYSISYLSTGRDILRFEFNSAYKAKTAIVIADPDFDYALNSTSPLPSNTTEPSTRQSRNLDLGEVIFNRLTGIREEGEIIANLLNARRWLGDSALKKHFFESVHSPFILHIATHGFFLPNQKQDIEFGELLNNTSQLLSSGLENPLLRSCLALAGANWKSKGFTPHPDAGNGILTAEEVSTLNLSATEVVVLSACETGLGEVHTGEGVFGLRRAFVLAGAKTLIMSLWKVPDQQTKELMRDFYSRILKGEPRSEALKNAQLEIRKKYSDPYYWGAFICQGNPDPL